MKIIKIDYDAMENTIACYKNSLDMLNSDLKTLSVNMKALKSEWKGETQKNFFKMYDNFDKAMQSDIQHLEFLKSQLEETMKSFKNIDQKYANLNIQR